MSAMSMEEDGLNSVVPSTPPFTLSMPSPSLDVDVPPISPKSPGSLYTKTSIDCTANSLVTHIPLCFWDNILGPRVCHLWSCDDTDETPANRSALNHIASLTLCGEICRDPTDPNVDFKFFLIKESGLIVTSFVFGALGSTDFGMHSLSVVVKQSHMQRCLQMQQLMKSWMLRGVGQLRVLMEKERGAEAMDKFTPYLIQFSQMLTSLTESGLPSHISDCDIDAAFNADNGCQFDRHFLCRAIASHLITCGSTIVIGENLHKVNKMIATLGMFLSPAERLCSRFVLYGNKSCPYSPDLFVQGFLQSPSGELTISLKDVHLSQHPTTLVNLSTQEVKYSSLPHQHPLLHYKAVKRHLEQLWNSSSSDDYLLSEMFLTFDEAETLITNLFEEWLLLPPSIRLQEDYISQFIHSLDRKAMALIRLVEAETSNGLHPNKLSTKRLRQDLSLKVPGDFYIVLATAEKLKPGIFQFLGKTNRGNLDQFSLLDSF